METKILLITIVDRIARLVKFGLFMLLYYWLLSTFSIPVALGLIVAFTFIVFVVDAS